MCTRFLRYLGSSESKSNRDALMFSERNHTFRSSGSSLDQYCLLHTSLSSRSSATPLTGSMNTLLQQPYVPDYLSERDYIREENPEAMFDMLTIQTLRERYQDTSAVDVTDGHPLLNDQDFDTYVRDFPIDDSISECFSSPDNAMRKAVNLPVSAPRRNPSTPTKQNKLKKKLQQRNVSEEEIQSDDDAKSSDSKKSKLISTIFGKKPKNKEGYKPLKSSENRESPDITNAIIDACEQITNSYTKTKPTGNGSFDVGTPKTKNETKTGLRKTEGGFPEIREERRIVDKDAESDALRTSLSSSQRIRGLPPLPTEAVGGKTMPNSEVRAKSFSKHENSDRIPSYSTRTPRDSANNLSPGRSSTSAHINGTNPDLQEIERLLALNDDAMIKSLRLMTVEEIQRLMDIADSRLMRCCIQDGRLGVVSFLTSEFPDVLSANHIKMAIKMGQNECVKCLMEQLSLNNAVEENLMAELFAVAVINDKADSLSEIIPYYDADPPSQLPRDQDGNTAAHLAAKDGRLECLQVLLENGFDIWTTNKEGHTAMRLALDHTHFPLYRYLILYQTCHCLLRETVLSKKLIQEARIQRLATHTALEQVQEQLLRCQEQFNDVMRELMANQEAILQTLDHVYRDSCYIVRKTDNNQNLRDRLDVLKSEADQLQDLFDFSPFVTSTDWMSKVIKEFQNVIEHDVIEAPEGGLTPSFNSSDVHSALSSAIRNASTCNRQHICDMDQCVNTQVYGAVETLMTKKPGSSSVSPASSRSGYDMKHLQRPSTTVVQDGGVMAKSRPPDFTQSERIYVNEVSRLPPITHLSEDACKDELDFQHESSISETLSMHSPSNTDSVCSTIVTSGVLESDSVSNWTSRFGTITCDTSESGSDWWDKSRDILRVETRPSRALGGVSDNDDDDNSAASVRLNLEHEDLSDEELMKHRLQQHLKSMDKMHNPRGEFVERVVTATGRRVGKNLDPSFMQGDSKQNHRKQPSRQRKSGDRKKKGIKLFSVSDIDSDEETDEAKFEGKRKDLNGNRWTEMYSADMEGDGENRKPWYEMSEDDESIIQSLKSEEEEEDDASLICHI